MKGVFDATALITRHLENVKARIIERMEAKKRNASGRHVASLQITATPSSGALFGLWSYNVMETGRRGGRVPRNFAAIIYQWSIDKGIRVSPIPYTTKGPHKMTPEERGRWNFAGAVAHRIMKEGTSLFRSGVREDIYSAAIAEECGKIHNECTQQVGAMISNINKDIL